MKRFLKLKMEVFKMKKKVIIIICIVVVVIIATALIVPRILGGAHVGIDNNPEAEVKGESNILVVYFSWSGNLQQMARWTAEETGGDLFRIVPAESYGEDYGACADRAKNELDNGIHPELSAHIDAETMAKYDTIYLGFPVWWYDLPMPVWSFLEEYDLSGKTIIPFFSHNGSKDGANSLNRVKELAPDSTVRAEDAISIRDASVESSEKEVKEWASGFLKEN